VVGGRDERGWEMNGIEVEEGVRDEGTTRKRRSKWFQCLMRLSHRTTAKLGYTPVRDGRC
jgi:hypothetical protein